MYIYIFVKYLFLFWTDNEKNVTCIIDSIYNRFRMRETLRKIEAMSEPFQ